MQIQRDFDDEEERLSSLPLFGTDRFEDDNIEVDDHDQGEGHGQGEDFFGHGQQQPHSSSGYSSSSIESHLLLSSGDSDDNVDSIAKEIRVSFTLFLLKQFSPARSHAARSLL